MKEWNIGDIVNNSEYMQAAIYCNSKGDRHIESIDNSFIIVETVKYEPTLEETLTELEQKYNMPRVIREGILGNPSMYSEFNVLRARELEEIAKKIRDLKEGK